MQFVLIHARLSAERRAACVLWFCGVGVMLGGTEIAMLTKLLLELIQLLRDREQAKAAQQKSSSVVVIVKIDGNGKQN